MLKRFCDDGFVPDKVIAVEQPFSVEIHDPETGVIQEEALVGAIDLVAEHEGRTVIVEHKTAARRFAQGRLLARFETDFRTTTDLPKKWGSAIVVSGHELLSLGIHERMSPNHPGF